MVYRYSLILITLLFVFSVLSCATSEMVSEKSIEYLNKKYNEKFRVISVNMNHDEGNWGSADLVVSPENDSSLTFSVVYDYSSDRLTWENYKGSLWNREIGKEAESIINPPEWDVNVKARITSKGSLALDSMSLPDIRDYNEVVTAMEKPAVSFDIDLFTADDCFDRELPYDYFINAAESFRARGFIKVVFSVNIYCDEKREKASRMLRFKLTKDLPVPAVNSLKKLAVSYDGPQVDVRIREMYSEAEKLRLSGNDVRALNLYMMVVKMNDNPYRYDPYAPAESGLVIESAFYAAEIERKKGNFERARKLYTLVAERLRYIDIKPEYLEMEKTSAIYSGKKK